MQESDMIPFKTSPLPEGPWLVFAPHADDETFGMGGSLLLAKKSNIPVTLLVLTDGAKGGSDDLPIEQLIETRRQEVLRVVEQLGIVNVTFLEQPDQHLISHQKLITNTVKQIKQSQAKSVFIPALTEFHPDHRATAYIAWQALRACHFSNNILSYEITSQQAGANYLIDISPVIDKKRQIMELYQSQLDENNYIDSIISINKSRTYTLSQNIEYAEAFYYFNTPERSLTLNTIEQFRPYWEQENEQKEILISIIIQTQDNTFSSIQSVLEQTYQNIELILVNNGAQTNADEFQYAEQSLNRIQMLNISPAEAYSIAMNKGLVQCQGDFILILDEGDSIYPAQIESLLTKIREKNAQIVYSDIETSQGNIFKQAFAYPLLLSNRFIPLHGLLFSRDFLGNGLKFNTQLEAGQHWDFLMQLSQLGYFNYLNICGGFSKLNPHIKTASTALLEQWIKTLGIDGLKKTFQLTVNNLQLNEQSHHQLSGKIKTLSLELQSSQLISENKERALYEKDLAIHEKTRALNDISNAINEKNQALNEKDIAIREKDEAIREKDKAIREKDEAIREKDKAISELFSAIKDKDNAIINKDAVNEALIQTQAKDNNLLSEQQNFISHQAGVIHSKEQLISQLQTDHTLLTHSLSWRVTIPLRQLKALFKSK